MLVWFLVQREGFWRAKEIISPQHFEFCVFTLLVAVCSEWYLFTSLKFVGRLGSSRLSSLLSLHKFCVFSGLLFLEWEGKMLILFYGSFSFLSSFLLFFPLFFSSLFCHFIHFPLLLFSPHSPPRFLLKVLLLFFKSFLIPETIRSKAAPLNPVYV